MKLLPLSFFGLLFFLFFYSAVQAQSTTAKVAVGAYQSLVLNEEGKVYTFGSSVRGVLGQGDAKRMDIPGIIEHPALADKKIADASFINQSGLILMDDGKVFAMGDGVSDYAFGPALQASGGEKYYPRLISETALDTSKIIDVEMGDNTAGSFSVFLNEQGKVLVVGGNFNGYLGIGPSTSPVTEITLIDQTNLANEKVTKISSSNRHILMMTESNKVFAVGENIVGQLGDGTITGRIIPVQIPQEYFDGKTIKDILAEEGVSTVLTTDGTVYRWGNFRQSLGHGTISSSIIVPTPITHPNLEGKAIASMSGVIGFTEGAMLVANDGAVFVIGENSTGNLGKGDFIGNNTTFTKIPASYFDNKPIVEASISGGFSLFRASDGTLFGSGLIAGNGYINSTPRPLPVLTNLVTGKVFTKIFTHSFGALLVDSTGVGFSLINRNNGTLDPRLELSPRYELRDVNGIKDTPTLLAHSNLSGHEIVDVKAGGRSSYLLTKAGKVFSFGAGDQGTLGTGDSLDAYVPTLITHANLNGKKIIDIAVSWNRIEGTDSKSHALLLADDGSLFSMGSNDEGQLGLGDTQNRFVPTPVTTNLSGKTIHKIAANGKNSMAVATDGSMYLWGSRNNGEMGFVGNTNNLNVPTLATHANVGGKKVIDGAIGFIGGTVPDSHFLVLLEDNSLYSFGEGSDGGLGQGDKNDNYVPAPVVNTLIGSEKIIALQAGHKNTSVVLTESGKIFSWGTVWTVGFDTFSFTDYSSPTLVLSNAVDNKKVVSVAVNDEHSLALLDDGKVLSFGITYSGMNFGAFGNGHSNTGELAADYPSQRLPTDIANFTAYNSPIPTTNLSMHLNANRLGFVTSNDSVTTMTDMSGNGNIGTQASLNFRPIVVDSAINNQKVLRFNGSSTAFNLPTTSTLGIQNSDYEIFMVAKSAVSTTDINFLMAGAGENFEIHTNGSAGVRFIPNNGNYIDQGAVGSYTDGNGYMVNVRATDTYANTTVNRSNSTQVAINGRSSDGSNLVLGLRPNVGYWYNGDIAEVIIYNTVLSDADRGKVEEYLVSKYGIANRLNASATLTGTEGWRLLASPVADSSFAPLLANLWTQGFTGAKVENGTPNVFMWDTTSATSDNTNWKALSRMDTTLQPGSAALVYVFSDDNYDEPGDAGFPKSLSVSGMEPLGTQDFSARLNPNINGFALIGNPFRYDIDWDAFNKHSLSNSVYVYDHNASGWKSWNGSLGSLSNGVIGAYNGFFVQTQGTSAKLEIPDSAKTYAAEEFLGKQVAKAGPYYFSLEFTSESGLTNKAWFQFSEGGEFGIDASDAHQLNPLSSRYVTAASILGEKTQLDINSLPLTNETIEIPLALQSTESGIKHSFTKTDWNIPEGWEVRLHDSELDISSDLSEPYEFTIASEKAKKVSDKNGSIDLPSLASITQPARQKGEQVRFILTVYPANSVGIAPLPDLPEAVELEQNYPNPFNPTTTIRYGVPKTGEVTMEVFDLLGRKVATLINRESKQAGRYSIQFDAGSLASGLYLYRLKTGNSTITKKLTLIK